MSHSLDEVTNRTLLTQVAECAGEGVCKPPMRFDYRKGEGGETTTAEHDPLGRLVAVTDAAQGITAYTYGPFGW